MRLEYFHSVATDLSGTVFSETRIYQANLLPVSEPFISRRMSIFGEFWVPAASFAFHDTFQQIPELVIEIERVVATDEILTPYFWVSDISPDDFETVAYDDASIDRLRRLDEYEEATLYRAEWTDRVDTLIYAYTHIGATILDAEGKRDEWMLRLRFDERDNLNGFNEYLQAENIPFELRRLYEISHPKSGGQYGLTPKQTEAMITAWEMGYFALPREATMAEVGKELGISPQSLSDRLRRAQNALIENTLMFEGPTDSALSGPIET